MAGADLLIMASLSSPVVVGRFSPASPLQQAFLPVLPLTAP